MAAKRKISVKLAGKEFPMTISQVDEEKYRRAAQDINALITRYKTRFVAEPEDYLAMAALQIAVDKVSLEMDREMTPEMEAIEALNREIDLYLNRPQR
ncbi:MAG: cell division protein ZapA [Alistipes sp.]|nr:cell division protein ZapA [Alistipes sp.]